MRETRTYNHQAPTAKPPSGRARGSTWPPEGRPLENLPIGKFQNAPSCGRKILDQHALPWGGGGVLCCKDTKMHMLYTRNRRNGINFMFHNYSLLLNLQVKNKDFLKIAKKQKHSLS